jgi:hypothetical protein
MENQLVTVAEENGLEKAQISVLTEGFVEILDEAKTAVAKAKNIVVTDISQKKEMKEAKELRIELRDLRVAADKLGKAKKEGALKYGKAVDGIRNLFKDLIEPAEEYLEKQEKFAEVQEELRQEKVCQERIAALSKFVPDTAVYNLKEMSEEGFAQLLKDSEVAYNVRIAAEKKAEEDRIAKEKAEKEEQERIKAENEKLKKKLEAEKAEAERKLKEKEEAEAKAAKEKAEAEEKARKEAEAEQEKLAKASDTDKIAKLIKDIEAISFPEVKSHKAKQVIADIKSKLGQFKELLGQI